MRKALAVNNRTNRFIQISGGVDPSIEFNTNLVDSNFDPSKPDDKQTFLVPGVAITGIPYPGGRAKQTQAVNKLYVDEIKDEVQIIANEIRDLPLQEFYMNTPLVDPEMGEDADGNPIQIGADSGYTFTYTFVTDNLQPGFKWEAKDIIQKNKNYIF